MVISFTPEEQERIQIRHIKKHLLPLNYLLDREKCWKAKVKEGKEKGKKFWNGKIYSIDRVFQYDDNTPVIALKDSCFKDYIFKEKITAEVLESKYGKKCECINCGVSILPVTKDKKLVVGIKKYSDRMKANVLASIAGHLNLDEQIVNSISDIEKHAKRETEEEFGNIELFSEFRFIGVAIFRSYCEFVFSCEINLKEEEIESHIPKSEFVSFKTMSVGEILEYENVLIDLEFLAKYIKTGQLRI